MAGQIMEAGFSPLWNPLLSCGTPLFSQPGLALGYPGILPVILLPAGWGSGAFVLMHALLAAAGFYRVFRARGSGFAAAAGAAGAVLALALSFFQPSACASLAWLPWVFLQLSFAARAASMAMLFSCADLYLLLAALAVLLWRRQPFLRPAVTGIILAAASLFPALESAFGTEAAASGFPKIEQSEAARLKSQARESRVFFDPVLGKGAAPAPAGGPYWAGGSLRPTRKFARELQQLPPVVSERNDTLGLWGAAFSLSSTADSLQRIRAPMRAALVSTAEIQGSSAPDPALRRRPFLSRPLSIEAPSQTFAQTGAGATWTMLQYRANAIGESQIELPSSHSGGWLYVSDTYFRGWTSEVDGVPSGIVLAEGAFRAVKVEAGSKTVKFKYRPWLFYMAWAISMLFMLLFSIFAWKNAGLALTKAG